MRPIKLEVTAIGPYKTTEVIDFTKLQHHSLFVISGPTGAGKTTIFDAICFALFGTASGSDRQNVTMLRSHFAAEDVHTAVQFIFQLHDRTYRVLRQLGHKKANNKTATGEKYELYEILPDETEIPAVERQIVSEINKKLEQLIGLTEDQFKQIVMLPQGEFRKLLTSETENKEAILRRLFKTEKYKQFNHILQEQREQLLSHFSQEKKMLDHYMESVPTICEVRENSSLSKLLEQATYNSGQVMEALTSEVAFLQEQEKIEADTYKTANKAYENKLSMYNESKTINEQFQMKEEKETALKALIDQSVLFKQKEQTLRNAEEAAKILPYEQQLTERSAELNQHEKALNNYQTSLTEKEVVHEAAKQTYEKELALEDERTTIKKEEDRLTTYKPIVEAMQQTKEKLQQMHEKLKADQEKSKAYGEKIATHEQENETLKRKMDEAAESLKQKANLENTRKVLLEQYNTIKIFQEIHITATASKKRLNESMTNLQKKQEKYKQLEATWFNNQAVVLAAHLHDGEACPVCGSEEHPQKAIIANDSISKEALDEHKKQLEIAENDVRTLEQAHYRHEGDWKASKRQLDSFQIPIDHLDTTKASILQEGQTTKGQIEQLVQTEKSYDIWKKQLTNNEELLKRLRREKELLEEQFREAYATYTADKSLFVESKKEIPEELQQLETFLAHLEKTRQKRIQLEKDFEMAEKNLRQVEKELVSIQQSVKHTETSIASVAAQVKKLEEHFILQIEVASFETKEAYEKAKMTENERTILKKEIDAYTEKKTLLQHQVNELKETLQHKEKVDMGVLKEEVDTMKASVEQVFEQMQHTKNTVNRVMELRENMKNVSGKVQKLEEEAAVVDDLYNVLRGQNDRKISFERYLQIDYLEQITQAANGRFRSLTNGQYYLIRSDRQETHGRQSGLAIDVYDAYTGQTRDVKTLSGGEKFIASLCLALGMSDVIQSFQGSISIETMFIDEGFGSLDDESLQKAIDALVSLQETGRMIGVISHVEELKTIFPAMLEVTKTKEGYSKAVFKIK